MLHLRAPAKVNLVLRVLGTRPDGYHELETLFERIDLADELAFEQIPTGPALSLTCDNPALNCGEDNLVLKAARLLQQTFHMTQGASIHLKKRIPIAAGLGGGSSDAATTLAGLNRLWNAGASQDQLSELAAQLGSDVAFFMQPSAFAIGRGRGEICEPLSAPYPTLYQVLVTPNVKLSTPEVYAGFDAQKSALTGAEGSITISTHALRNGSLGELAKGLWNDLEPEAIRRCPIINDIRNLLRQGGCLKAVTSGSGPSVVGLCHDAAAARAAADRIRLHGQPDWFVAVTKTDQPSSPKI